MNRKSERRAERDAQLMEETAGVYTHTCDAESQIFYLNEDGTVSCAMCDENLASVRWSRTRVQ